MFRMRKPRPGGRLETDRFYVYYGLGTSEALSRLSGEPLVIVELRQWHPDGLHELKKKGTQVFGYLPIMESPAWNKNRMERLGSEDYFKIDGEPVRFSEWDSFLMELRSSSYRRLLFDETEEMHSRWPIDGLFLDTVGDIEEYVPGHARQSMSEAYRAFLAVTASRYPETKLIQNRGFSQLENCQTFLDGYLWEDWRAEWSHNPRTAMQIKMLRKWNATGGLGLLALSATHSESDRKSALAEGFLHRTIDSGYQVLP